MNKKHFFQRVLHFRHIIAISVGGTISSTYFLGNGYILSQIGPFAFLAFIFGGLISFLTMECMTELAAHEDPSHHSFVGYAKEYISPSWACGVGWAYWANWVIYIPTECIAGGLLMQDYFPGIPVYMWATIFAILIMLINICRVKIFADTAFWLTFTHMALFIGFTVLGLLIFFGIVGNQSGEIVGTKYLIDEGGMFPKGFAVFFINMIILLLNFQGTEIIGLSASESHKPRKDVAHAMEGIAGTITALYVLPIFVLALIFPWKNATLEGSVFAIALQSYGFKNIGHIFTFLIVAGVLSCANSGLYAASRTLHAMSALGLSPKKLDKISHRGTPNHATIFTFIVVWLIMLVAYFFPSKKVYENFLALSGFCGSIAWISICWSQLIFRKKRGEGSPLKYKIWGYPYITYFAIWAQVLCLVVIIYSPDLRPSFYMGVPILLIPILLHKTKDRWKPYWARWTKGKL